MYRVMIVDDEPLILAGITSMLDWEACGCRIVGKASNGQQALERMEKLQPDIVITDIKMPAMNGIDFIKHAREQGYTAQFLLLTNLEEFSLVKEAMHLGVVDYLVKLELTEETLTAGLMKAVRECDRNQPEESHGQVRTEEDMVHGYFANLLMEDSAQEQPRETTERVFALFQKPMVLLINFNYKFEGFSQAFTRDDQKKVMSFAENIIGEMADGFFDRKCLLRWEQNSFLLVVSAAGIPDCQPLTETMSRKMISVLKDYFEISVSVAVSTVGESPADFMDLTYQAMSAMNYYYYDSTSQVVFYSGLCEVNDHHNSNFNISFLKKDLSQAVRQNDSENFRRIMDQLISLFEEYRPCKAQAVSACSNLYYFITSIYEDDEEARFPYAVNILAQLNRLGSLSDIISWIRWFSEEVEAVFGRKRVCKSDKNIVLAQSYILEHYREKITLGQVADALKLSQSYLSSIFKKHSGKNFSDYVSEVKVEKAKELIASHEYMMYEISDMLGFDTPYYFSTVFKKVTGRTPKEYEALTVHKKKE